MKALTTLILIHLIWYPLFGQIPTNGLFAHYSFNGDVNNQVSNLHHGQVYGATLTTDRFNNENSAYFFNGIDNFIEVEDHSELRPDSISISFWVSLVEEKDTWQAIISKFKTDITGNGNYVVATQGINALHSAFHYGSICESGDDWERDTTIASWNLGGWDHIVVTYDGDLRTYYMNGQIVVQNNFYAEFWNCEGSPLRFGGNEWSVQQQFFEGKLDDIRIYGRALSNEEVGGLFNSESSGTTSTSPLSSNDNFEFVLYPNPVSNQLNITFDQGVIGKELRIFNAQGSQMHAEKSAGTTTFKVNASNFPSGLYFIEVSTQDGKMFNKFIKH